MLPLDLHVLGLPLAFILSQDQTLRCKNFEFYVVSKIFAISIILRCFLHFSIFQRTFLLIIKSFKLNNHNTLNIFLSPKLVSFRRAKIESYFLLTSYWWRKNKTFFYSRFFNFLTYLSARLRGAKVHCFFTTARGFEKKTEYIFQRA